MRGKRLILDQHEIDSVIFQLGKVTGSFWHVQTDPRIKPGNPRAAVFYSNGPTLYKNWDEAEALAVKNALNKFGISVRLSKFDNWVNDDTLSTFNLRTVRVWSIYITSFQAWKVMESDGVRKAISLHII